MAKPSEILAAFRLVSGAVRLAEERHPENVKALPPWLQKAVAGVQFADGTEVAAKIGTALWNNGGGDPQAMSEAEVLALIPEAERKRFTGEPKQLVAAVRAAYLVGKTMGAFKGAAAQGQP